MTEGFAPTPTERAVGAIGARLWWAAPAAAALVTAALAELSIGREPIQADEAQRLGLADGPIGRLWETAWNDDLAHLTTNLFWKPWLAIAGSSEEAVRYPSVIFAGLAATVTVLIGKQLLGWLAGAVAGLAMATSGFVLGTALHAASPALALFLVTAATYALLRATDGDRLPWWLAYVLLMALTATASLAAVSVLAAHIALLALRRPARVTVAAAAVGAVIALVAGYVVLLARTDAWRLDWLDSPTARSVGEALWAITGSNPVIAVAALAGLVALGLRYVPRADLSTAVLLGLWLIAPLLATLAVSLWRPAFSSDYLVAMAPALALAAGATVAAARRWQAAWIAGAFALAAGASVSTVDALRTDTGVDWRAAARYVAAKRA
ncbi:MAG: hypothetical protein FJW96_13345, partial [Actinobacteria bacterium]|nr:hypothetical protein [Actinomycetota bacterium]